MSPTRSRAASPVVVEEDAVVRAARWATSETAVRRAVAWIRRRGKVTTVEMVEWDRTHGQHLFEWDNAQAGVAYRLHQARLFLGGIKHLIDGFEVHAFVNLPAQADGSLEERTYVPIEAVSANDIWREQVVTAISQRLVKLGKELQMWRLSPVERDALFVRLADAMGVPWVPTA